MSFKETCRKLFTISTPKAKGDLANYIEKIKDGSFKNMIVFGVTTVQKGFHILNPTLSPGGIFCGGMGSGKSIAMRFTSLTSMLSSSEETLYLFYDSEKGMSDYKKMFDYENVVPFINDRGKIVPVIDMLYQEVKAREEVFEAAGVNGVVAYNKKMKAEGKKPMARILVFIEEFHAIPSSKVMKFSMKYDVEGSIANKFANLMRISRSAGVAFHLATQKGTSEDIPSALKPGLAMMQAFRMSTPGEAGALDLPHASEIFDNDVGRCAVRGPGFGQYPYIDDKLMMKLLKKYYKPLDAEFAKYKPEDFAKAVEGVGSDGLAEIKPYTDLVQFFNEYRFVAIAKRFLKAFNFEVVEQKNPAYIASYIATKEGKKYAVYLYENSREQGKQKEIDALKKGKDLLECDHIIAMSIEHSPSSQINGLGKEEGNLVIDPDDFRQMAKVLDDKDSLTERKQYNELFLELELGTEEDLRKEGRIESNDNIVEEVAEVTTPLEPQKEIKTIVKEITTIKEQEVSVEKIEAKKEVEQPVAKKEVEKIESVGEEDKVVSLASLRKRMKAEVAIKKKETKKAEEISSATNRSLDDILKDLKKKTN
jgi:hypothetical protein